MLIPLAPMAFSICEDVFKITYRNIIFDRMATIISWGLPPLSHKRVPIGRLTTEAGDWGLPPNSHKQVSSDYSSRLWPSSTLQLTCSQCNCKMRLWPSWTLPQTCCQLCCAGTRLPPPPQPSTLLTFCQITPAQIKLDGVAPLTLHR